MYGLRDKDLSAIRQVFATCPQIESTILYGSRAHGDYRPSSDIDIVLQGDNLSHRHIADIENKLDNLYLPYTIDLSDMKSLTSPALIMNIKRDGKAI